MTTTWDFDSNSGGSGGSNKVEFTKFPPGITSIRVIDEAPFVRWTHWQPKHQRSINCPGRGCPICEIRKQQKANKEQYTHQMSRRLAIQILNRGTGKLEVCEMGPTWFQDLRDLMEELRSDGKTLLDVDIKVKRRGTGKDDTSYRLDIGDEYPLSDADMALMATKQDLATFFKPHTSEQIIRVLRGEDWATVMTGNSAAEPSADSAPFEEANEEIAVR